MAADRPPRKPTSLFAMMRRWTLRLGCFLAGVFVVLFGWLFTAGGIASSASADCIVVPGAAVRPGRVPSDALRYRLEGAVRLYEQGRAPIIIVTGGGKGDYAEADVMQEWLIEHGIPPEAIIAENESMTTRDSGIHVARIMGERGLESALVSSQWFHVARTRLCLAQEGVTTHAAPCGGNTLRREPYFVLREMVGLPVYAVRLDERRNLE
jgi:uncharacterized SAM-binding protein YcdF (DUF218 family)